MPIAYVALGANVPGPYGPPAEAVAKAMDLLDNGDIRVMARSRLYRSPAWPDPSDPEFVNAVAKVETSLPGAALLNRLHEIEKTFGRSRGVRNAPRPLDLDIVDYDGAVSAPGAVPILPHPRLRDRAFVLLPLRDVAPAWIHPEDRTPIAQLVARLPDRDAAKPPS